MVTANNLNYMVATNKLNKVFKAVILISPFILYSMSLKFRIVSLKSINISL